MSKIMEMESGLIRLEKRVLERVKEIAFMRPGGQKMPEKPAA